MKKTLKAVLVSLAINFMSLNTYANFEPINQKKNNNKENINYCLNANLNIIGHYPNTSLYKFNNDPKHDLNIIGYYTNKFLKEQKVLTNLNLDEPNSDIIYYEGYFTLTNNIDQSKLISKSNLEKLATIAGLYAGTIKSELKKDHYNLNGYFNQTKNPCALIKALINSDLNGDGIIEKQELEELEFILSEKLAK